MSNQIQNKLVAIMRDCEAIGKSRRNSQQGYNFRGIDDVANELHSHFAKHGVIVLPEVLTTSQVERQTKAGGAVFYTTITVKYTFMAEDGSTVSCVAAGEGMDSGDKSTNKAMSAALKYSLLQVFLIPTEEKKDSEEDSHEVVSEPTKSEKVNGMTEAQYEVLEKLVSNSRDLGELQTVWNTHPQYHTHTSFKAIVTKHKKFLNEVLQQTN